MRLMRPPAYVLFFAFCAGSGTAVGDDSAKACGPSPTVTPLATETASAGTLSNLMNRAGSIRATSKSMLSNAIETAKSGAPGQRIIFKSTPELSAKTGADDPMCDRYKKATTKEPLVFNDKHFATVDELTDWIMDFTQGNGADGRLLYEQCPGKCSPQYTWWIDPVNSELNVDARVVCGPPRDHDSDKYQLSIGLTTSCLATKSK
jgi:hypothetical protein